jgi:hypothetical protein
MSLEVVPKDRPRICVCAAPDEPTVHKSLLIEVIVGATAVGGGDFTVVVLVDSLLDVESVTIVSANDNDAAVTIMIATSIFFMVLCFSYVFIMKTARNIIRITTSIYAAQINLTVF